MSSIKFICVFLLSVVPCKTIFFADNNISTGIVSVVLRRLLQSYYEIEVYVQWNSLYEDYRLWSQCITPVLIFGTVVEVHPRVGLIRLG